MTTINPPKDGDFTPSTQQVQKIAKEKSDRDEGLAVDILKLAVEANKAAPITSDELANYAEKLWRWVTTETWALPTDTPPKP